MCRRYKIPVYATLGTWKAMIDTVGKIDPDLIHYIAAEVPFEISGVRFHPFATSHDTAESIGIIFSNGEKFGAVATDLGTVTKHIFDLLSPCSIALLEANHDENMLRTGSYPAHLKERILSDKGHLSNRICGALCGKLAREGSLKQISLGHLSSDNNTPRKAYEAVAGSLSAAGLTPGEDVMLYVANRYSISEELTY